MKRHLSGRIAVAAGTLAAVIMVLLTVLIGVTVQSMFRDIQLEQRRLLLSDYDELIRSQVDTAISLLGFHHQRALAGEVSPAQARRDAADALRELRYGSEGYFWADTTEGVNVVLLGREVEGTSRIDLQDVNGLYLIREIIARGSQPEGGYTDYWFPKSDGGEAFPKRGYSRLFEPFGWVVGTGNYIDEIESVIAGLEQENSHRLRRLIFTIAGASLLAVALFVVAIIIIGRRLTRPLARVTTALDEISRGAGDLTRRLAIESDDEVGEVAGSFDTFVGSLQSIIAGVKTSTATLQELGTELASNMTETAAAVNEITANIESLTRQVETQGGQVDTTASAVEELTRNIDALNEQVERESQTIAHTSETIGTMIAGVESMLSSSGSTRDQIQALRERIEKGNHAADEMQSAVEAISARSRQLQEANSFIVNIAH
jgi:methyl-accepting chemotaxis protein